MGKEEGLDTKTSISWFTKRGNSINFYKDSLAAVGGSIMNLSYNGAYGDDQ